MTHAGVVQDQQSERPVEDATVEIPVAELIEDDDALLDPNNLFDLTRRRFATKRIDGDEPLSWLGYNADA
mgnify:FL=1|tara:strand:- start:1029 stop:1238 length:210 start_codon:yes stop_codon:yes gene_type:complete